VRNNGYLLRYLQLFAGRPDAGGRPFQPAVRVLGPVGAVQTVGELIQAVPFGVGLIRFVRNPGAGYAFHRESGANSLR